MLTSPPPLVLIVPVTARVPAVTDVKPPCVVVPPIVSVPAPDLVTLLAAWLVEFRLPLTCQLPEPVNRKVWMPAPPPPMTRSEPKVARLDELFVNVRVPAPPPHVMLNVPAPSPRVNAPAPAASVMLFMRQAVVLAPLSMLRLPVWRAVRFRLMPGLPAPPANALVP
jgi:hypothetical protein